MSYSPRSDSWAGRLTEEDLCGIFKRSMGIGTDELPQLFDWIQQEYADKVTKRPSQTSFYAWRKLFRPIYNRHETEKVRHAGILVAEYARANDVTDEQYVSALKAIASRAMVANDADTMAQCIRSAMEITASQQKRVDLDLKARAQATKEADLALAREKFEAAEKRLAAVQDAVKTAKTKGGITEETLRKIEEAAGLL